RTPLQCAPEYATCRSGGRSADYAVPTTATEVRMSDERIEILRRVPLFDGLNDKELEAVANTAKERRYDTGDTIVGEVELLDESGRRTASVIAESPLRVFGITAWQFAAARAAPRDLAEAGEDPRP